MRCLILLLPILFSTASFADIRFDDSRFINRYYTAKLGQLQIDVPGFISPTVAGAGIGYKFSETKNKNILFFEAEYMQTIDRNDEILGYDFTASRIQLNDRLFSPSQLDRLNGHNIFLRSYGVYGGYRTQGPLYFKARAGYVSYDLDFGLYPMRNNNLSYSIGFGFDGALTELEYTSLDEDLSILSLNFLF